MTHYLRRAGGVPPSTSTLSATSTLSSSSPKKIFIVPYRDREANKAAFLKQMQYVLEDEPDPYEIYFAHQCDTRPFNRGAMKNIGFLAMKRKYSQTYKDIIFIFHDVDTWPADKNLIPYTTTPGVVAHFFGYTFSLGGMFAITGADFEKTLGFPNFWGWGLEDNAIQHRVLKAGLKIDRSCFYPIDDAEHIIRPFDGFNRVMSLRDSEVFNHETPDNFTSLQNIRHSVEGEYINIYNFTCAMNPDEQVYRNYDIRRGARIPTAQGFYRRVWNMKKMFS